MKMMIALLAGVGLMMATTSNVQATPLTIRVSNDAGANWKTITDNVLGGGDTDGSTGTISAALSGFGNFCIKTLSGSDTSDLQNASLQIESLETTSTLGGTLYIQLSQTGFSFPTGAVTAETGLALTGTGLTSTNGPIIATINAYSGTELFNTTNLLSTGTVTAIKGNSSLGDSWGADFAPITGLFSLTEELIVTQGKGLKSQLTGTLNVTPVPEPGTMLLIGTGFLGLAIYGKRRKNT